MARIDALPSLEIIRGLKGILDFYVWKGLPCVRAWPRWRPARQSDASLAAALLFGAIIKAFSLSHGTVLQQLAVETTGIPRTPRDLYLSGVFGNLHEASMSDFLDLLTECRDFLSALTALLNALDSIDTDELVVNVDQSVLPPLAATTTNQATAITALQKLDDLQDALESKALDRLLVRGMDQLFSFKDSLILRTQAVISGAGGWIESPGPGAGVAWIVTTVAARDRTSAVTGIEMNTRRGGVDNAFHALWAVLAQWQYVSWAGHLPLVQGDTVRATFNGALAGDTCEIILSGYIMTLET